MRYVYSKEHELHAPRFEVDVGIPTPAFDAVDRPERIREALLVDGGFEEVPAQSHGPDPIRAVHDDGLVRYLERAWSEWAAAGYSDPLIPDTFPHPSLRAGMGAHPEPDDPVARAGFWTFETMTPILPGSFEAATASADAALTATDLVLDGDRVAYGLCRPPGHHATHGAYGGYCFFNNAAIAAQHIVDLTGEQVACLDVDYHHGNGIQQIFYARGDVLYASLHGDPRRAYPYFVGYEDETGSGEGEGANINVPLSAGIDDDAFLEALEPVLDRVDDFPGNVMVVSLGLDVYLDDPICDFAVTTEGLNRIGRAVARIDKRAVVVQEGGYAIEALGANARSFLAGMEGRD